MRAIIIFLFLFAFAKTSFAQLPDTLRRGDMLIVLNADSTFYIYYRSKIANDVFDLVQVAKDSSEVRAMLLENWLTASGMEGIAIDNARKEKAKALQAAWLIRQFNDTTNLRQYARNVYASKLAGKYILRKGREREVLVFNANLIARRSGKDNVRMLVSSQTNIELVNIAKNAIQFTTSDVSGVLNFVGFDDKGNEITLKKIN